MRRVSIYTDRREPLDVKMTPMIDVVFLLLIFFVWTASFQIVERILPSAVSHVSGTGTETPDEPPPPEADFHDIVVRVVWNGTTATWRVGAENFTELGGVKQKLTAIFRVNDEAPVIIDPDEETPFGSVIEIYDLSRQVGFAKVKLATSDQA